MVLLRRAGNRTVKAGIFHFDGYHMKDDAGSLSGYGIDFLNLAGFLSYFIIYIGCTTSFFRQFFLCLPHLRLTPGNPENKYKYAACPPHTPPICFPNHTPWEPVDLNRALEERVAAFYTALSERNINPRIRMPEERPPQFPRHTFAECES